MHSNSTPSPRSATEPGGGVSVGAETDDVPLLAEIADVTRYKTGPQGSSRKREMHFL